MIQEITIGRERGAENPRLAVETEGKAMYLGKPGSVPSSVSRNHCRITIDEQGKILLEDLTANNFMYVNGTECKKRRNVQPDDTVELGPDRYKLDLDGIIKTVNSNKQWHIAPLEKIYESYQQEKMDKQVKQAKINALSALPGILSMTSIGLSFAMPALRVPMIILAAVLAIFFFVFRFKKAEADPKETKRKEDLYREKYVCPNPACGRFLGATPYKELLRNRACPYCKAKFVK